MLTLLFEWIFWQPALTFKEASQLLQQCQGKADADFDRRLIVARAGRKGPPVTKRGAAIAALFRREYLQKPWEEISRRVCPCGERHTNERVMTQCKPRLQAEVRHLKQLLRRCEIEV